MWILPVCPIHQLFKAAKMGIFVLKHLHKMSEVRKINAPLFNFGLRKISIPQTTFFLLLEITVCAKNSFFLHAQKDTEWISYIAWAKEVPIIFSEVVTFTSVFFSKVFQVFEIFTDDFSTAQVGREKT